MIEQTNKQRDRRPSHWTQRRWILGGLALLALLAACASLGPSFGSLPDGKRLQRIEKSPHYRDGAFQYTEPTDTWTGGGQWSYLKQVFFGESQQTAPTRPIPVVDTDLAKLDLSQDVVVWLGHSSIYLQIAGKRILVDPIFSDHASPLPFVAKAFKGPYPFSAERLPPLDYLVISHDHWDHLDKATLVALRHKVQAVVTSLGVGAYLEGWGYPPELIHERDWFEQVNLAPGLTIHILPARHFSGRGLQENKTQWASFLIESSNRKVFYSGDGGYGPHFAEIGRRFGPIDLALMENGQYDPHWAHMHMMPEEVPQAAKDLRAKQFIPVHAGRFDLASHAWSDPFERVEAASLRAGVPLLTPRIGEPVRLGEAHQRFRSWWKSL